MQMSSLPEITMTFAQLSQTVLATTGQEPHADDTARCLAIASLSVAVLSAAGALLSAYAATKANQISKKANRISKTTRLDANRNAEAIQEIHLTQEKIRSFEQKYEELMEHRAGLQRNLAKLEAAADRGQLDLNDESVVQHSRMVSRAFRRAMRHYGDAYGTYELLRDRLEPSEASDLDHRMNEAARFFKREFDTECHRGIVAKHDDALRNLTKVVSRALADLRTKLEPAVKGHDGTIGTDHGADETAGSPSRANPVS